jgi:hypothetical protein
MFTYFYAFPYSFSYGVLIDNLRTGCGYDKYLSAVKGMLWFWPTFFKSYSLALAWGYEERGCRWHLY